MTHDPGRGEREHDDFGGAGVQIVHPVVEERRGDFGYSHCAEHPRCSEGQAIARASTKTVTWSLEIVTMSHYT